MQRNATTKIKIYLPIFKLYESNFVLYISYGVYVKKSKCYKSLALLMIYYLSIMANSRKPEN